MQSSVIESFDYDPIEKHLDVRFVSGRRYRYHDVPEYLVLDLERAASKGEFFNERVRDQFRHSLVS